MNRAKLKELAINITDGEHGTVKNDLSGNYYLLSNKNIIDGTIRISADDRRISKPTFERIRSRTKLSKNDIVIATVGTIGKAAIIKSKNINYDFQRSVGIIKCRTEKLIPEFLYYCFCLPYVQKQLIDRVNRSVQKCLYIGDLEDLEVDYPNIEAQQEIVDVLSTLDAKIKINNHINTELELIAKTLYDYWFVQFDFPNENGKPYKHSGGSMVWNAELKREIPEGWNIDDLGIFEKNIITGKTPPKTNPEYFNGEIPFITIGDIRGNAFVVNTEETLSKAGADYQSNKYIHKGAMCVTCIASPGLVGFASELSQTNQQINSIECEKEENKYYIYFAIKGFFKVARAKSGNTFANMNKGDFASIRIIVPPNEIIKKFTMHIKTNFEQILGNSLENKTLSSLRDWLLPMLMNGQVKIN